MKVEQTKLKPIFDPVVITLETQEEVDKLFAIVNFVPIHDLLEMNKLREGLLEFKSVNYIGFHNKLKDRL